MSCSCHMECSLSKFVPVLWPGIYFEFDSEKNIRPGKLEYTVLACQS